MTANAESVDRAIQRLRAGEAIGSILANDPYVADDLAPLLEIAARLSAPPPPPLPAPELVRADRNDFLLEIALLQVEAVSPRPVNRLKDRMVHLLSWRFPIQLFRKKEKWQMSTIAITVTVLLALVMGSVGGVTTLASQSMPGSPIYTMKLFMEETTLFMAPDPETRAEQHLLMFQERSREVQQLALSGEIPDEALINRLELHLRQTLHFASRMEPERQAPFLLRVQSTLEEQNGVMAQLSGEVEEPIRVKLEAVNRVMVQADEQIDAQLRERQQEREQRGADELPTPPMQPSVTPPQFRHGNEAGAGTGVEDGAVLQCEGCVPAGDENHYGPQPDEPSPGPGQQGGNPEPCEECTPAGDEHKYGQADEAVTEPALVAPTVESVSPCADCEPAGDENHYGPQPDKPGPGAGEPGGNPAPCTDCVPAGDENKHGQTEGTVSEPAPEATTVESTTPCQDCEPVGEANQYEQNPDESPPGTPGGNPEPCTDCEPAGDENKHGQTEVTVSEPAPATETTQTDDAETAEENSRAENEETGQSAPDTGQSGGGGRSR